MLAVRYPSGPTRAGGREGREDSRTGGRGSLSREGEKRFLLYRDTLSAGHPIELQGDNGAVHAVTLEFPKAGHWLIPDPFVWIGLILIGLVLGAVAALILRPLATARACYAAISAVMVLTVYFWGLGFAARLARLLPAAALLLVIVAAARLLFWPIQHQKAKSDQTPDEHRDSV